MKAYILSLFFYAIVSSFSPLYAHYTFSPEPIDAVIPCHVKDAEKLSLVINGIRENVANIRRIIVISSAQCTDEAEWFDERNFPFCKQSLALELFDGDEHKADEFVHNPRTRIGWIYQQLLKLYAPITIPDISSNVLIVDADTIFLRPVSFTHPITHAGYLTSAYEYHKPYFEHATRLINGFKKQTSHSGVAHHMLFQRPVIEDLLHTIEEQHNTDAWRAFCRCIDMNELWGSCMSEYEIYANFALSQCSDIFFRSLNWRNFINQNPQKVTHNGYDYISCHTYIS